MKELLGWFSCGATSAVACKLALEKFGELVELYYIETGASHNDNTRFLSECEDWYGRKINIIRSEKFNSPLDVARKELFNTPYGAPCTKYLKKEVRKDLVKKLNNPIQVFGFDYSKKEVNRALRFSEQNEGTFYFPLLENRLTKEKCLEILLSNKIKLPVMYTLGYNNNNCIGCFKGGAGYWNKIRVDFPETFEKVKELEIETKHTVLKKDGKQFYLRDLKESSGNHKDLSLPDCGLFCDLELNNLKVFEDLDEIIEKLKLVC